MALDIATPADARRPTPTPAVRAERRARFLQTVAESLDTRLVDNLDHLFHPWGVELPDPARAGERISAQLDQVERCDVIWDRLGDERSRELLLRFFAYRALGPAHVRLQLEPGEYRRGVIGLAARAMRSAAVLGTHAMPMEWQLHHYDLSPAGLPIQVIGSPLPLASTLLFSQYAYRDPTVAARPQPGDVVVDVGGCWGETALWLAHAVGPTGYVHTFEPTPGNRKLLEYNLKLNPGLAPQIAVWDQPLAGQAGDTVWLPDVVGAGTATLAAPDPDRPTVELLSESIDHLVRGYQIPQVDFLKIDVEGADLGVLEGAAQTIRTQRPRLAIACYHKPDDLVTIPEFVASLGADYRWYLQCSTMTDVDTVAFAVPV